MTTYGRVKTFDKYLYVFWLPRLLCPILWYSFTITDNTKSASSGTEISFESFEFESGNPAVEAVRTQWCLGGTRCWLGRGTAQRTTSYKWFRFYGKCCMFCVKWSLRTPSAASKHYRRIYTQVCISIPRSSVSTPLDAPSQPCVSSEEWVMSAWYVWS